MFDVVLFADNVEGAFSPQHNASKPTGGTEVHMVQLEEGLAASGLRVCGVSPLRDGDREAPAEPAATKGSVYVPIEAAADPKWAPLASRALITAGLTKPPAWLKTDRHVILWTHDPGHNVPHLEAAGLRWSEFVCVSQWQADRFPRGWKTRVIPPIVDDAVYSLPAVEKAPGKFVCVSAWWKGTQQTLEAWSQIRPPGAELHIGSPYSHPPNARSIVERVPGCVWVELASPRAVVEAMRDAAGVFRVCMQPETFGVTDVIAQILGCRVHILAPNGLGGAAEALCAPHCATENVEQFALQVRTPPEPETIGNVFLDLRASNVIPLWRKLLDL